MEQNIDALMDMLGAVSWREGFYWRGYYVYVPIYAKTTYIGEPTVVLANEKEIRFSSHEESFEYLKYEQEHLK